MNQQTQVLNSIEPLLHVCIKQAKRHGLDEIRISLSRASELHRDIVRALKQNTSTKPTHTNSLDRHLDNIHNL